MCVFQPSTSFQLTSIRVEIEPCLKENFSFHACLSDATPENLVFQNRPRARDDSGRLPPWSRPSCRDGCFRNCFLDRYGDRLRSSCEMSYSSSGFLSHQVVALFLWSLIVNLAVVKVSQQRAQQQSDAVYLRVSAQQTISGLMYP